MRKFFVVLGMVFGLVCSVIAADAAAPVTDSTTETPAVTASATTPKIESPEMNLQTEGALPAQFRGGDPDSSLVHVLEDQKYTRKEHTLLYEDDASGLSEEAASSGVKFEGDPTISWTNERVNPDGSVTVLSNENTNLAANESEFPEPGEYRVGNSGARQVGSGKTDTAAASETSQRVTSTQTMGVLCHDCTSPNLWAVFQEGAGSTNLVETEAKLKEELKKQMEAVKGEFSMEAPLAGDLKEASLLAMFESPKNVKPTQKVSAVAVRGPLFDKTGKRVADVGGIAPMKIADQELQTRQANFSVSESAPADAKLKGIFVRRNVPFLAAVHMTDNGAYNSDGASCKIVYAGTDDPVEKTDGAYFFRVPNYPREEYKDQRGYEFVMEGSDEAGNKTTMRVPLYVVNTQSAIEGGKNE